MDAAPLPAAGRVGRSADGGAVAGDGVCAEVGMCRGTYLPRARRARQASQSGGTVCAGSDSTQVNDHNFCTPFLYKLYHKSCIEHCIFVSVYKAAQAQYKLVPWWVEQISSTMVARLAAGMAALARRSRPVRVRRHYSVAQPSDDDYDCYKSLVGLLMERLSFRVQYHMDMILDFSFYQRFARVADGSDAHVFNYPILFLENFFIGEGDPYFDYPGPAPGKEWVARLTPLLDEWDRLPTEDLWPAMEFAQRLACAAERDVFAVSETSLTGFRDWRDGVRRVAMDSDLHCECGMSDYGFKSLAKCVSGSKREYDFVPSNELDADSYSIAKDALERARKVVEAGAPRDPSWLPLAVSQLPVVTRLVEHQGRMLDEAKKRPPCYMRPPGFG
ncbi:hypothetical protein SELMODRAFT_407418 [Selaginella moellendorffii]|uniref:Uncharacterized protein n=1 Tax=Selaginella moellendorffii TaxID=88036 RepID=D8R5J2_SELML|nr:hypothetical protein SELMODRAFT_407418 [Selaginella moellendorffii]